MSNSFAVARRYLASTSAQSNRAVIERETILGVKVFSEVIGDEIWLILDRSFMPGDGLACYYADEIPALKNKTQEELREIHNIKLVFPGCRVIQDP